MITENHLSEFRGRRLLVVGGAGFVGGNLVSSLLDYAPEKILLVDNLLSGDPANIPTDPRIEFVYGSIASDRLLGDLPRNFDFVWHLSCFHGNQSSIYDPIADHENNLLPSLKLFDWLKNLTTIKKIVYAAAGCAVAEKTYAKAHATPEDAPVSLYHDSPYSISKLVGELYGNYYWSQYRLPLVKARFQNVYGPGEILGAGQWRGTPYTVWRNVIPVFIWKALNGEALPLDNGGRGSRDFIYVGDIVRGLIKCAVQGDPGEVFNLASGVETTILELANLINEITENSTPPEVKPPRDWDNSGKRFGSTDKSRDVLGFSTEIELREGLVRTVEWTKKHHALIASTMARHDIHMRAHAK